MTALGFGAVSLIPLHLVALALGSGLAARSAGRPVRLLGSSANRWSAAGYRAAFALAFLGPLLWRFRKVAAPGALIRGTAETEGEAGLRALLERLVPPG